MKRVLACIMCGCMLEEEDRDAGTCPRCRLAKESGAPQASSGSVFDPGNLRSSKKAQTPPVPAPGSRPAPEVPPAPPRKPRILVADDEPVLLKFLCSRLVSQGFETLTAADGQEAFEKAVREKPDLILTDVLMPRMTGYDLLHKLQKQTDGSEHIPVLVMTAKGAMKEFFGDWEIHGFMTKPIDPAELITKIKELISIAERVRAKKKGKKK